MKKPRRKRKELRDTLKPELASLLRDHRTRVGVGIKSAGPSLGVSYSYLSKIENGVVSPSAELLGKMAAYYNADQDQIFIAADRLPPDIQDIFRRHASEAINLLRKSFPS